MKKTMLLFFTMILARNAGFANVIETYERASSIQSLSEIQVSDNQGVLRTSVEKILNSPLRASEIETLFSLYDRMSRLEVSDVQILSVLFQQYPDQQRNYISLWKRLASFSKVKSNVYSDSELQQLRTEIEDQDSAIFLNGIRLSVYNISTLPKQTMNWLYLSDRFEPLFLRGELLDFLILLQSKKEFSSACFSDLSFWKNTKFSSYKKNSNGVCSDVSSQQLYAELHRSYTESQNDQSKRNWILPLSILAGAVIAYELRNKDVLIHMPSFKF